MGEWEAGHVVHNVDGGAQDCFLEQGHVFIGIDRDLEVWRGNEGVVGEE